MPNEVNKLTTEIDVPNTKFSQQQKEANDKFATTSILERKINKDTYNTIRGHYLLIICLVLIMLIYFFETFVHGGKISDIASNAIEVIKVLIFSLTGYLFGKNANESDK